MAKASMNLWRVLYILAALLVTYLFTGSIGLGIVITIIMLVGILTIVMNWIIGD